MAPKTFWNCDIDTTKSGLERFARALLMTGSTMTSSFILSHHFGRGVSAFTRVLVPDDRKEEFEEIAKPIGGLRVPPKVAV